MKHSFVFFSVSPVSQVVPGKLKMVKEYFGKLLKRYVYNRCLSRTYYDFSVKLSPSLSLLLLLSSFLVYAFGKRQSKVLQKYKHLDLSARGKSSAGASSSTQQPPPKLLPMLHPPHAASTAAGSCPTLPLPTASCSASWGGLSANPRRPRNPTSDCWGAVGIVDPPPPGGAAPRRSLKRGGRGCAGRRLLPVAVYIFVSGEIDMFSLFWDTWDDVGGYCVRCVVCARLKVEHVIECRLCFCSGKWPRKKGGGFFG